MNFLELKIFGGTYAYLKTILITKQVKQARKKKFIAITFDAKKNLNNILSELC